MPPKKDAAAAATGKDAGSASDLLIPGFTARDHKFLVAALLSCTGPGKVRQRTIPMLEPVAIISAHGTPINAHPLTIPL